MIDQQASMDSQLAQVPEVPGDISPDWIDRQTCPCYLSQGNCLGPEGCLEKKVHCLNLPVIVKEEAQNLFYCYREAIGEETQTLFYF